MLQVQYDFKKIGQQINHNNYLANKLIKRIAIFQQKATQHTIDTVIHSHDACMLYMKCFMQKQLHRSVHLLRREYLWWCANHINRHGRCHRWTNTAPVRIVLAKYCLSPTARHAPAGCSRYLRMVQSQYPSEKAGEDYHI